MRGPKTAPVEGNDGPFAFRRWTPTRSSRQSIPPVILTTAEEFDLWLDGDSVDAIKLQRPLPVEMLRIVERREKEDSAPATLNRVETQIRLIGFDESDPSTGLS